MINMSNSRKQAIVGGLAGAIGALLILGLLLCFCLRRRQKRSDDDEDEEDGLKKPVQKPMTLGTKASTIRLWTTLGRDTARTTPEISRPKTAATIDGTEYWTHPANRKKPMRGSLEPAPLNVVNSNNNVGNAFLVLPRSKTPQQENEEEVGKPGFIRKQRSALATLLQDGARTNSRNAVRKGPVSYPNSVTGDPVYSSKAKVEDSREVSSIPEEEEEEEEEEGEAERGETHSVGSLPSDTSSLMVVQQPPADPFFASTTMLSTMEEVAPPMPDSPSKQQQQQQELSRTVSHFGKTANPFRTQSVPSIALPPRIFSYSNPNFRASDAARVAALNNANGNNNNNINHARKSSLGSAYSRRQTAGTTHVPSKRSSDQFDLLISPDQLSPLSNILTKTADFEQREEDEKKKQQHQQQQQQQQQQQNQREETPEEPGSSPNWYVYEGT
jgi:hypothetical protein